MNVRDAMVAAIVLHYDKSLGKYFYMFLRLYIPHICLIL